MQTSVYRSRVALWLAIGISMCWTLARSFGLGAFPAADTASFSLCLAASLSSVARRLSPRSPSPSAAKLSTSTHSAAASTAPTVAKRLPAAIVFRFQLKGPHLLSIPATKIRKLPLTAPPGGAKGRRRMESGLQTVFLVDVAGRSLAEPDFRRCVRACQRHSRPARRALRERAMFACAGWLTVVMRVGSRCVELAVLRIKLYHKHYGRHAR